MLKVIYKYLLTLNNKQTIIVKEGYKILCAKNQRGSPVLWCLVDNDTNCPEEHIVIRVFVTGCPIVDDMEELKYIDTVLLDNDYFVCHIFEQL